MSDAILIDGLRKVYPGGFRRSPVVAVDGISMKVSEGEAFGFVGANGAGKSTTIKILTGLLKQTAGRSELFGVACTDPGARVGLGYVPENPSLFDYLTPLETLQIGTRMHGVNAPNPKGHCLEWLDRFELAQVANRQIRGFSKGMCQRVALAHAMAIRPRLLILDEPLSGLDPMGRRLVVDMLSEYRAKGGTVFFSSHVLHDVERLADRFGLIHQGRLLTISSPQALLHDQSDAFIVRYRCPDASPLPASTRVRDGEFEVETVSDKLRAVLADVEQRGQLVEVRPSTSLETIFMRVIRDGATAVQPERRGAMH